ncbi:bifunctional 4-hydroxy-2-oxoglutarate aldolase/2-dehydro-3-deoxy-phosphogluconate aldolase [Microbacterium sp. H37-C3]|uniref:bifunctional 4-hydroxy-2-oxoglutarate aldolase/2-dehydro-3-deoxy-phosphogluconate aldolase n=1 Tax=Microbacterium sp. H37-C3 TaxID=3004354 RepID=UPI0022AEFA20|nr:bifunctional 4-hydroxy-2-oxoglutarate aldolase/2-dehydro-3-deoxy-phosphogluconate aldolase [Microbacterium sp. H37-C3]MCZ4068997.1 bifunctional 4-hydroxy-2-oxoglutarate aldolase/2-dehydro-3-deoxy-phosphogluconate aldolase [Microbacterium sp. H37-C3]
MNTPLDALIAARVVPVVVLHDAATAEPLADALVAGGIRAIEITLRTPAGLDALASLASRDDLIVGAGTVTSQRELADVRAAGARFAVSPGFDADLVDAARETDVLPVPGIGSATDAQAARRAGLDHVKVYPAGVLGGLPFIRALHGPFPEMRFMPSGGVDQAKAAEYLADPAIFAVSGSWMVPAEAIRAGDFETITTLARTTMAALDA